MLQARATDAEIETYRRTEIVDHFGLSPEHCDFAIAPLDPEWGWQSAFPSAKLPLDLRSLGL